MAPLDCVDKRDGRYIFNIQDCMVSMQKGLILSSAQRRLRCLQETPTASGNCYCHTFTGYPFRELFLLIPLLYSASKAESRKYQQQDEWGEKRVITSNGRTAHTM